MPVDGDAGGRGTPVDGGMPGGRGIPADEGAPGGDGGRGTPGDDGGETGAAGGWAGVPGTEGGFWVPSPLPKNLLKKLSLSLMVYNSQNRRRNSSTLVSPLAMRASVRSSRVGISCLRAN